MRSRRAAASAVSRQRPRAARRTCRRCHRSCGHASRSRSVHPALAASTGAPRPRFVLPALVARGLRRRPPRRAATTSASTSAGKPASAVRRDPPLARLAPVAAGTLATAVQDAAAAPFGGGAVLVGGLTPADTSSDSIVDGDARRLAPGRPDPGRAARRRRGDARPHDVRVRRRQRRRAARHDPRRSTRARAPRSRSGTCRAGSSDQAGAAIGRTAYIVGGYTGGRWLDTIVAWRPAGTAHVVAHLPHTLRYAAVTAAAGGS